MLYHDYDVIMTSQYPKTHFLKHDQLPIQVRCQTTRINKQISTSGWFTSFFHDYDVMISKHGTPNRNFLFLLQYNFIECFQPNRGLLLLHNFLFCFLIRIYLLLSFYLLEIELKYIQGIIVGLYYTLRSRLQAYIS